MAKQMSELDAIEELWRFQREYRKTRKRVLAMQADRLAKKHRFTTPPWVRYALEPRSPKRTSRDRFNESIANAFGFMPGDFEQAVEQAEYDMTMFARRETLLAKG